MIVGPRVGKEVGLREGTFVGKPSRVVGLILGLPGDKVGSPVTALPGDAVGPGVVADAGKIGVTAGLSEMTDGAPIDGAESVVIVGRSAMEGTAVGDAVLLVNSFSNPTGDRRCAVVVGADEKEGTVDAVGAGEPLVSATEGTVGRLGVTSCGR